MKKYLFLSLAFLFCFQQMIGQNILTGKVQDFDTEEELIGANIIISQNGEMVFGTATDENGEYSIKLEDFPDGTYEMMISYLGYESMKFPIHFDKNSGEIISSTFLNPSKLVLEEITVIEYKIFPKCSLRGCVTAVEETCSLNCCCVKCKTSTEYKSKLKPREKISFSVFPNPTIDIINIETPTEVKRLLLFDANGRLLVNKESNSLKGSLDLTRFPAGQYLLQIVTEELSEIHKIIKLE